MCFCMQRSNMPHSHRVLCNLTWCFQLFFMYQMTLQNVLKNKTLQAHTSQANEHRTDIRELNTIFVMWSTYVPKRDPRPDLRFPSKNWISQLLPPTIYSKELASQIKQKLRVSQAMPPSRHWANVAPSESLNKVLSDGSRLGFANTWPAAYMKHTVFTQSNFKVIPPCSMKQTWEFHVSRAFNVITNKEGPGGLNGIPLWSFDRNKLTRKYNVISDSMTRCHGIFLHWEVLNTKSKHRLLEYGIYRYFSSSYRHIMSYRRFVLSNALRSWENQSHGS